MSDDFRARARAWLEANAPHRAASDEEAEADTRGRAVVLAEQKAFQARLFDAGFAGITWPKEYGGQGLGSAEQIIWSQESRDYDLPTGAFFIGISMPGNTLVELGTEEQKKRYLPPMLRGEEIWCQLFSEPGAGSDVASLQTSAVRDGDEWVLNGQKVWTSGAQFSDYGAILARTDPTKPKHNGISMFIVDMHAPGVTVRPLKVATGHSPFNEVFFDNVRIPADALIGEENKGWDAAVVMLRHERIAIGTMGGSRTSPLAYDSLRDLAAGLGRTSDQGVRRDLAELYALGRATQLFATAAARGSAGRADARSPRLGGEAGRVGARAVRRQRGGGRARRSARRVRRGRVRGRHDGDHRGPRRRDRGRHQRHPAQHHRRARARPGQGPRRRPGDPVQSAARWHAASELSTGRLR